MSGGERQQVGVSGHKRERGGAQRAPAAAPSPLSSWTEKESKKKDCRQGKARPPAHAHSPLPAAPLTVVVCGRDGARRLPRGRGGREPGNVHELLTLGLALAGAGVGGRKGEEAAGGRAGGAVDGGQALAVAGRKRRGGAAAVLGGRPREQGVAQGGRRGGAAGAGAREGGLAGARGALGGGGGALAALPQPPGAQQAHNGAPPSGALSRRGRQAGEQEAGRRQEREGRPVQLHRAGRVQAAGEGGADDTITCQVTGSRTRTWHRHLGGRLAHTRPCASSLTARAHAHPVEDVRGPLREARCACPSALLAGAACPRLCAG